MGSAHSVWKVRIVFGKCAFYLESAHYLGKVHSTKGLSFTVRIILGKYILEKVIHSFFYSGSLGWILRAGRSFTKEEDRREVLRQDDRQSQYSER